MSKCELKFQIYYRYILSCLFTDFHHKTLKKQLNINNFGKHNQHSPDITLGCICTSRNKTPAQGTAAKCLCLEEPTYSNLEARPKFEQNEIPSPSLL